MREGWALTNVINIDRFPLAPKTPGWLSLSDFVCAEERPARSTTLGRLSGNSPICGSLIEWTHFFRWTSLVVSNDTRSRIGRFHRELGNRAFARSNCCGCDRCVVISSFVVYISTCQGPPLHLSGIVINGIWCRFRCIVICNARVTR